MESSMGDSQKIKNRTNILPRNSTSGNISKGNKNSNSERYQRPYLHNTIYSSQEILSLDEWIKELWYINICAN